jgi:hypothetical protein
MDLFHKLTRSFKDIKIQENAAYTKLGSSTWRKAAGKMRYLKLMLAVTRPRSNDIVTPFAADLYGGVTQFMFAVDETFTDDYLTKGLLPKNRFFRKIYEPSSIYDKAMHINAINQYYSYLEPRKYDLTPSGKGLDLYRKHRFALLKNWDAVSKMDADDLVAFIEPNVNIGADLWITQNKKNFPEHFADVTQRWFGKAFDFTLHGVLDMCQVGIEKQVFLPNTAFYRGKDSKEVRGVFGGPVPMKAIGAIIQALKAEKIDYPKLSPHATLPWGPWEDWSNYFPKFTQVVESAYDKESLNVVGEDFKKYDTTIRPEDLKPLVTPINDKLSVIYNYVMEHLDNSVTYLGPYAFKDFYYVSGHPFTSELASGLHAELAYQYEAESEATVVDGSVQSDDNAILWRDLDVPDYYKWLGDHGYAVKEKGSSNLNEHGYMRFLQNDIGRIKKGFDESVYVGAFDSRYPKMIHLETGGDVLNWIITEDLEVDRMISKLGSFGEHGTEMVEAILNLIRNNKVGRRVIRGIQNMSDFDVVSKRRDIVGFHPSWLTKVILPDTTLKTLN